MQVFSWHREWNIFENILLVLMSLKSLRDWKVVSRGQYHSVASFADLYYRYSNTLLVIFNNRLVLQRSETSPRGGDEWQGHFSNRKALNPSMPHHFSNPRPIIISVARQTDSDSGNDTSPGQMVSSHYCHLLCTTDETFAFQHNDKPSRYSGLAFQSV